ncbi:helix-turn-helix protein [Stackebrandtia endophytica]|uniref:Helix-turn-helix protein n=2 Tax=Stackebrandtia endophytica TaxID=1496996 RepID=A0A543AS86_9ACTN|nr:helix-turn-helix protein [Stackebrandtia endophytica]
MSAPSPGVGSPGGPTALRMLLGAHLRKLREERGISRKDAGWEIRSSDSKISRMELGRVSFKERDVEDLLKHYGVVEPELTRLIQLARDANNPGWWHRFGEVLPNWFQSYLGLEATASLIRTYEIQFIPGLLQTKDYARAVVMLGHGFAGREEIEQRVNLRVSRQEVLFREKNPPRLWAVLDEAALRRPLGSIDVMRAQLERLIEIAELPNVQIQIIPFSAGGHAAAGGAFTMLRFQDVDLPDIVYLEQLTSALYLDKREDVDLYTASMEHLCVQAEEPRRTPELLSSILKDLTAD